MKLCRFYRKLRYVRVGKKVNLVRERKKKDLTYGTRSWTEEKEEGYDSYIILGSWRRLQEVQFGWVVGLQRIIHRITQ